MEDQTVSRPAYQRIANDLRARIASGDLAPGDQLPTQEELHEAYGAARGTIVRAIDQLVHEGLVVSRRPLGVFVRGRQRLVIRPQAEYEPAPSAAMDRLMAAIAEAGLHPERTLDVALPKAPKDVAERLGVDLGAVVVLRRRTTSAGGELYNINDSYYPLDLVSGSEIMLPDDITRGARQVLAELGHEEVRAVDELYTRMPTPDESHRLDLAPGTPVVVYVCTAYAAGSRPVRCTVNVLPGDRHVIVYERHRPE
jgi:GntR family transcriptional regulator